MLETNGSGDEYGWPQGTLIPGTTELFGNYPQQFLWDTQPNGYIKTLNPNKCKVCNSIIEYNSRARVRNRKYCNLQCSGKSKIQLSIEEYEKNPLKCCECNQIVLFSKKRKRKSVHFCGNKCAAIYRGRNFKLSDAGLKSLT